MPYCQFWYGVMELFRVNNSPIYFIKIRNIWRYGTILGWPKSSLSPCLSIVEMKCTWMRIGSYKNAHCVLLKHYYSVDFPWWFERKICRDFFHFTVWWSKRKNLSNDRNSKLHFAIWQKKCFSWILSACSSGLRFCKNLQINLEAKSMHGSSWKKNSIVSEFTLFFAGQVLFTVNGLL